MSTLEIFSSKRFSRNVTSFLDNISESFLGQFTREDSVINPDAKLLLRNPKDRAIIDDAVQELKKNRSLKRKTIKLSGNREITLSVK